LGPNASEDWALGDRIGVLNFRNPCASCGLSVATDIGTGIAANIPSHLKSNIICKLNDSDTIEKLAQFSDGMGVDAVISCTDDVSATD
jgi:hypothetical protein